MTGWRGDERARIDGLLGEDLGLGRHGEGSALAVLLTRLGEPATVAELHQAECGARAFADLLGPPARSEPAERRPRGPLVRRSLALGAVAALFTAGSAAAAVGALPGPAQRAVAHALAKVGVDIPDHTDDAPGTDVPPPGTGRESATTSSGTVPGGGSSVESTTAVVPSAPAAEPATSSSAPATPSTATGGAADGLSNGHGQGTGNANANGQNNGQGNGNGQSNGQGNGNDNDNGNGNGNGQGDTNGRGDSQGNGQAQGQGTQGNGNGPGNGQAQRQGAQGNGANGQASRLGPSHEPEP